jgi:hypothetical protein
VLHPAADEALTNKAQVALKRKPATAVEVQQRTAPGALTRKKLATAAEAVQNRRAVCT